MSQAERRGPLDIVRAISRMAEELDEQAHEIAYGDEDALIELRALARETEEGHPLFKQGVVVYGTAVEAHSQAIFRCMHGSSDPEFFDQAGKYGGLMVCEASDGEDGSKSYRVVHVVHTGTSDPVPDGLGNLDIKLYMNYILATGSEVTPVLPINAHSLQDLEGDQVVAAADEVLHDDGLDEPEKITLLGEVVNEVLGAEEVVDDERNHQRASYINSFGLQSAARLAVRDVLVGDKEGRDTGGEFELATMDEVINLIPDMFDIMPGYSIDDGGEGFMLDTQELFVRTELQQHPYMVLVALKNVLGVEPR